MFQLVTFRDEEGVRPGVLFSGQVHELATGPVGERGLVQLIEEWPKWQETVEQAGIRPGRSVSDVELMAPLLYPGKILAAGANYRSHAQEMRAAAPQNTSAEEDPFLFMNPTRHCIIGPKAEIAVPLWAERIDWEVELAVVIGRPAYRVSREAALDYVFGYTIMIDVTSRKANHRTDGRFPHDWFSGKGLQTFGPMGPAITPREFFPNPPNVRLQLRVNGETMQDGNSSQLIFDIPTLIAYASERITLDPGDVISTGTPSGVGAGRGIFLNPGDVVEAEVEGIGFLTNPVVRLREED